MMKFLNQAINDFQEIINHIENKLNIFNEEQINENLTQLKILKKKM